MNTFIVSMLVLLSTTFSVIHNAEHCIWIKKGDTYRFKITANPSTGYAWYFKEKDTKSTLITILKEGYAASSSLIGSSGKQYWDIKGIKEGSQSFTLEYKRHWETTKKPIKTRDICISVHP